ncbi:hypothetical protein AQPE_0247 [Aquipluma nitroreducens]|uniref:Uncharacterized protein n=1 Tax=Aquipluma nitroreducens TaxID=2010828 RepID=A0A5K7S3Q8_9BACT|nr:hypothetical protein AQPE_0247 [Aquipluma nitroreducens]
MEKVTECEAWLRQAQPPNTTINTTVAEFIEATLDFSGWRSIPLPRI